MISRTELAASRLPGKHIAGNPLRSDAHPTAGTVLAEALVPWRALLGPYADRLILDPTPHEFELVPATTYCDPENVRAAIQALQARWETAEARAVASIWAKYYNAAVVSGVLAALTVAGVGLVARPDQVGVAVRDGLPAALVVNRFDAAVVSSSRAPASVVNHPAYQPITSLDNLYQLVFTGLFQEHLTPVIDAVHAAARLSRQILWGNVGNLCADFYDRLVDSPVAAQAAEDREAVLNVRDGSVIAGNQHPLHRSVRYEPLHDLGLSEPVRVRRTCCLQFRIPDRPICWCCPLLGRDERARLLHGLKEV